MNVEQERACTQLFRALNQCHKVGLEGGVYESRFCIWPKEVTPQEADDFFEAVELFGEMLPSPMNLDGGAGI